MMMDLINSIGNSWAKEHQEMSERPGPSLAALGLGAIPRKAEITTPVGLLLGSIMSASQKVKRTIYACSFLIQ